MPAQHFLHLPGNGGSHEKMPERRRGSAGRRSSQDFDPSFEWIQEEESDIFVLQLPDFKKEEVKLQLNDSGNLKITGKRKIEENKWSHFAKNVNVTADYDSRRLRANFENGVLKVTMPKISTPTQPQPQQAPQETAFFNQQMNEKVSETTENQETLEEDQEQVNAHAGDKKVISEKSEKYESAKEGADDGATRMMDDSLTRMMASGMGRRWTKQMIINIIVGALISLALLMYMKYTS